MDPWQRFSSTSRKPGPRLHQKYHEACKLVCVHNKTFGFEEH